MATHPTSRRRILSLGILSCAGAALPAAADSLLKTEPAWLSGLTRRLQGMSSWVRTATVAGVTELHCGLSDAAAWAGCSAKLAGRGNRVFARGNVLSFSLNGRDVRVVMHSA